jgi:hypothetical protein
MDPREDIRQGDERTGEERRRSERRQNESEFRASHRPSRAAPVDDDLGFDFGLRGGPAAPGRRRSGRRATDEFEASRNY